MAALREPDQTERVALALMAIEEALMVIDAPTRRRLHLAPLSILTAEAAEARLGLYAAGRRFILSLEDADLVVIALRMERAGRAHDAVADAIDAACRLAEKMRQIRDPRMVALVGAVA